jgi:nicotinamide mononucleotide transporter
MLEKLLEGLRATSPPEALSVLLGIGYVVYAVRRERIAWLLGALSSSLLVYLYVRARLPMQALLNAYYVAMSIYGYVEWSRPPSADSGIGTLPLRWHALAGVAILVAALASARLLAAETEAAWPFLDALTTWASLFATWLAARSRLENWLYWILIDAAVAVLSAAQGLISVALLFVIYLGFSALGFVSWWHKYLDSRARAPRAVAGL